MTAPSPASKTFTCDLERIGLSPYTWKLTGTSKEARAEAGMPGAYLKAVVSETTTIGLVIDGTANTGCTAGGMPVIEYSVDDGPFRHQQLSQTGALYTFPIAQKLDGSVSHKLEVYFRAAGLSESRWNSSQTHLRIAGISADAGAALLACPKRSKRAIAFGDSITEGVGAEGLFTSWDILEPSNARCTYVPLVCSALDCEYGQLGTGGQGLVQPSMPMPPLPKTWDRYAPSTSRLKNGRLLPEPDYVFCNMGTNDYGGLVITGAYIQWISAVRKACPNARIFCIVPPSGVHRSSVQSVVTTCNKKGDAKVYMVDTPSLNATIHDHEGATQMTYDGVHPSVFGHAVFAAHIVAAVQRILDNGR